MRTYRTAEVAKKFGVHPNTVRLYEELSLIPKAERQSNGYRVFTDLHLAQFQLARTAFQIEVLQNGLRKKIIEVVKTSARGEFDAALILTREYLALIHSEQQNAAEAVEISTQLLTGEVPENPLKRGRKEVSADLGISMDALRNWEMNGLLTIKRKENGYRVYTDRDIRQLKIIRALRCGGYSLASILRMLNALSAHPNTDIQQALNTPKPDEDIVSVCDKLIISLHTAENNARSMIEMLQEMKNADQQPSV